jgi:hypothetical protein
MNATTLPQPYRTLEALSTKELCQLMAQLQCGESPLLAERIGAFPHHIRHILLERERAAPPIDDAAFLATLDNPELNDCYQYWRSYCRESSEVNAADDEDLANYWIALIEDEIEFRISERQS